MPTPETSITVESCLAELREMFPRTPVRLSVRQDFVINGAARDPNDVYIHIGHERDSVYFEDAELADLMSQIREWKESQ